MKKYQLGLLSLGIVGALASCDVTVVPNDGYYGNSNSSAGVTLQPLTKYSTNHQLSADAKDQNGKTIPKGTFVICKNWDTEVFFDVNWSGYLKNIGFQFKGYNTGDYVNKGTYPVSNPSAGHAEATLILKSGMAPLSIIVNPVVRIDVLGYTYVRAQGIDKNGYYSNVVSTNSAIPVVICYES